jgi:hypothetical protein
LRRTNHRAIHEFPYVSRGPDTSGEVGLAAAVQRFLRRWLLPPGNGLRRSRGNE